MLLVWNLGSTRLLFKQLYATATSTTKIYFLALPARHIHFRLLTSLTNTIFKDVISTSIAISYFLESHSYFVLPYITLSLLILACILMTSCPTRSEIIKIYANTSVCVCVCVSLCVHIYMYMFMRIWLCAWVLSSFLVSM